MITDWRWCRDNPKAAASKIDALWRSKNNWMQKWAALQKSPPLPVGFLDGEAQASERDGGGK